MESMDKLSLMVQIFWLMIILSSIYLLVLSIMMPRIKKVLKMSKELYESKMKKLYEIKFKEYLIKWELEYLMKQNLGLLDKFKKLKEKSMKFMMYNFCLNKMYDYNNEKNIFLLKKILKNNND